MQSPDPFPGELPPARRAGGPMGGMRRDVTLRPANGATGLPSRGGRAGPAGPAPRSACQRPPPSVRVESARATQPHDQSAVRTRTVPSTHSTACSCLLSVVCSLQSDSAVLLRVLSPRVSVPSVVSGVLLSERDV